MKFDKAIREVINALAILVGFAWEQCFDTAVTAVASRSDIIPVLGDRPSVVKMILAIMCVLILVPAWRRHLLPMVTYQGYKFGVVLEQKQKLKGMKKQFNLMEAQEEKVHKEKMEVLEAKNRQKMKVAKVGSGHDAPLMHDVVRRRSSFTDKTMSRKEELEQAKALLIREGRTVNGGYQSAID